MRKPSISYTISYYDIEIYLVDIEKYKNSISMSPFVTFDIEKCDLRYRTRSISIHDIDCKNLRYRCAFDIERLRYRIFRTISCVRHTISGCQGSRWSRRVTLRVPRPSRPAARSKDQGRPVAAWPGQSARLCHGYTRQAPGMPVSESETVTVTAGLRLPDTVTVTAIRLAGRQCSAPPGRVARESG